MPKRKRLPWMDCVGFQEPAFSHSNRDGDSFYICYCEGCGDERRPNHEDNVSFEPPMFYRDPCGCTRQRALTEYVDDCQECGQETVYLTPGTAMRRKIAAEKGEVYEQRKLFCDDCMDLPVLRAQCRNAGCSSIGGKMTVEVTLGQKLWYEKHPELTYPPTNCEVCRRAIKAFKQVPEIRPTCDLCKKRFRVTDGVMIMTLKTEKKCEIPTECVRCRGLTLSERKQVERENELREDERKRFRELTALFNKDADAIRKERDRLAQSKEDSKKQLKAKLAALSRLRKTDMRATLRQAVREGHLLETLANPNAPGHQQLKSALAHLTGGKGAMTEKEFNALPGALHTILKDHPNAVGLLEKGPGYRAPGMSPVQQHYELLSAAALKSQEFKSVNGKSLKIYSTDSVHFGVKSAHGHAQPKQHGTIESDIAVLRNVQAETVISRNSGVIDQILLGQPTTIGIDAKHTLHDKYHAKTEDLRRELNGVRNNFNDGRLDQFFFVSNKQFDTTFKAEVTKTNLELVRDYIDRHNENIRAGGAEHLTSAEKASMPAGEVIVESLGGLKEYNQGIKDFVSKYEIPQVEICEHVKYVGT